MAAIIAQMTRANRERKKNKRYEISKCMYELPPFDPHFEPVVHNKYLRSKKASREIFRGVKFHKIVMKRLEEIVEERETNVVFTYKTFFVECSIVSLSLLLVPILMFGVQIFWPEQEFIIPLPTEGDQNHLNAVNQTIWVSEN